MCFSATASFGLSGALLLTGGYCVHRAVNRKRSFLPLALIPIFFGVQQLIEGAVWLALPERNSALLPPLALAYLFFALIFWPVWIPLCASLIERRPRTRRLLQFATLVGLVGSLALYLPVLIHPHLIHITIIDHSLHYGMEESPAFVLTERFPRLHDAFRILWQVIYVALVSTPLLVSSERRLADFGIAALLSAVVSHVFFAYAFASVWCYFAAVVAVYLGYVFWRLPAQVQAVAVPA